MYNPSIIFKSCAVVNEQFVQGFLGIRGSGKSQSVKERSSVEIILYDVLGRQVEVLVKEEQDAGNYIINFNAGQIASGVYLYRLKAGNFIETKKMVLLK